MLRKVIHNAYDFVIFQESPTPMKPSQVRYINVKSFCPLVNEYDINDAKMMQYTCNVPLKVILDQFYNCPVAVVFFK